MEIKLRVRLLKDKMKGIALERKELLREWRTHKIELNKLKDVKK